MRGPPQPCQPPCQPHQAEAEVGANAAAPSEAAAMATSESLRNMVRSFNSARRIGRHRVDPLPATAPAERPWGHPIECKPRPAMLNGGGMAASDTVHLGEIAVIRAFSGASPGRLPKAGGADISPATPVVSQGKIMATERTFSIIKP